MITYLRPKILITIINSMDTIMEAFLINNNS